MTPSRAPQYTTDESSRFAVIPAKNGLPTAVYGGRYLHSAYEPEKEAARFSRQAGELPPGSVVLLLGEALGYLARRLIKDNPGIRLLAVYVDAYFRERMPAADVRENAFWLPGTPESFSAFLSRTISDMDFPSLRVLEWEPAREAFPGLFAGLREELSRFGRQVNGTLLTAAVFGKKWITNTIRAYLALEEALVPQSLAGPVCLAASGPGLEDALPFLERHRKSFTLLALPSAQGFLRGNNIAPDGVVMTDPGFYTGFHFHAALRRKTEKGAVKLCMSLSAYPGVRGDGFVPCLFHQGTPPEAAFLSGLSPAPPRIPANGTVSGSAVHLALSLGAGPVILLGLDMAARGIQEHARPDAFDEYSAEKDCRLRPEESRRARRVFALYPERLSGAWRSSPALHTYSGWFSSMAGAWGGRVFRISSSPVDTGCLSSYSEAEKLLGEPPAMKCEQLILPSFRERRERVVSFIDSLGKLRGKEISGEAAELLLMADTAGVLELKKNPASEEAAEKLRRRLEDFQAFLYAVAGAAARFYL